MKKIIIGISSGIAGYKILELIKSLINKDYEIHVIMTRHASLMFSVRDFEQLTKNKVYTEIIPDNFNLEGTLKNRSVEHIELVKSISVFVIAPATANIIAKVAYGIADDFLTTSLLATKAPVLICPSMNSTMWLNPIVQENIRRLESRGYSILLPSTGSLVCGTEGIGRLPEVEDIFKKIEDIIKYRSRLKGKKIIVTSGGTSEPIDSVRVITNRASGKMGKEIAEEAYREGADVLLIKAKTAVGTNYPINTSEFETAIELERLIKKHINKYDYIFHTAAVSDFAPTKKYFRKIESKNSFNLRLKPIPKIIIKIKRWNPKIHLIGFKAVYNESEKSLIKKGYVKLQETGADFIIVNDVGRKDVGFMVDTNEIYIISDKGLVKKEDKALKSEIAKKILSCVIKYTS